MHWVSAGAMPHISLSSAPAGKEAREAVRTAIEQVQNEGGERTIGTPNRIALIFPPQITEGSDARRGVARAEERMDVASVVYQWGAGRDHARASWHISARLMPVEVVELGVAWCTRPARAAQVEVDEEPDSDPPAEQANANTCVNSEHEHGRQQAQPQEQVDATIEQAQPALSTTGSRNPLPTFDTRWRQPAVPSGQGSGPRQERASTGGKRTRRRSPPSRHYRRLARHRAIGRQHRSGCVSACASGAEVHAGSGRGRSKPRTHRG